MTGGAPSPGLTRLKSSMSSSCRELVGDAVADRGCSGDWERCNIFPPPRPSPSWALSSDWSMVVSWLVPSRPWPMSLNGTSMVIGDELLNWEPIGCPRSWATQENANKEQTNCNFETINPKLDSKMKAAIQSWFIQPVMSTPPGPAMLT